MKAWFRSSARERRAITLGDAHRHQVERRKATALCLVGLDTPAAARIESAPPAYLLAHGPSDIARHAELLSPAPAGAEARVLVTPGRSAREWRLDVSGRDRPGLLAAFTRVLADAGIEVVQAVLASWDDGAALQAFVVRAEGLPEAHDLQTRFEAALDEPLSSPPVPDADVTFDRAASPLYTACAVRAADRPGLLHAIAVAIAAAGGDVHAARVTTLDGVACDQFDLTDRVGRKLTPDMQAAIGAAIVDGVDRARPGRRAATVERV